MSFFADLIVFMSETDVIHLFFPWLLLLAFTFGVLEKFEYFEEEVNGAIALSSSFLAVAGVYFFMPEGIFANFGAVIALAGFVALGFMIVMAISGIDLEDMDDRTIAIPLGAGLTILVLGLIAIGSGILPVEEAIDQLSFDVQFVEDVFMPVLLLGFILAVIYLTSK